MVHKNKQENSLDFIDIIEMTTGDTILCWNNVSKDGYPVTKTLTVQEKIALVNELVKTMTLTEWAAAHEGIEFVERLLGKDEFERQRKHWESEE